MKLSVPPPRVRTPDPYWLAVALTLVAASVPALTVSALVAAVVGFSALFPVVGFRVRVPLPSLVSVVESVVAVELLVIVLVIVVFALPPIVRLRTVVVPPPKTNVLPEKVAPPALLALSVLSASVWVTVPPNSIA